MFSRLTILMALAMNLAVHPQAVAQVDAGARATGQFIQQRALDPIKFQTGLPEAASRLNAQHELQIGLVRNNVFMGGVEQTERLVLDGESSQINLRYRHRINGCWQFNASGVWISHSPGAFDGAVDAWHQFFNLPDAMRNEFPANELDYRYDDGDQIHSLSSEFSGAGDAQLQVQRYLGCDTAGSVVRIGLKVPVGSPENFSGNGAIDSFIDIQSPWRRSERFQSLQWAGSVGLLVSGDSELIVEQQPLVGFGVLGLNYSFNARHGLVAQLDWHTPVFESELTELGNPGAQLTLGYRLNLRDYGVWEVSFSEDISVDTAPDIAVRIGWLRQFGAAR